MSYQISNDYMVHDNDKDVYYVTVEYLVKNCGLEAYKALRLIDYHPQSGTINVDGKFLNVVEYNLFYGEYK